MIAALRRKGFRVSEEAGRAIIRQQKSIGSRALPQTDPVLFAEAMRAWELRAHDRARSGPGIVFFDRGLPDVLGYLDLMGLPVDPGLEAEAARLRYNRCVFTAPPWPEIFIQDEERKQTLEEAARTYDAVTQRYKRHGYELIELPRRPVEERVRFVLAEVAAASRPGA